MLIASLFIRVPDWNQPKCQSTGEYLNEMCYIHSVEYFSATENSVLQIHTTTCMYVVEKTKQKTMLLKKPGVKGLVCTLPFI